MLGVLHRSHSSGEQPIPVERTEDAKQALTPQLAILTIIQCVRLLFIAHLAHQHPMLTMVNITVCYIIIFVACMSIMPRTALACTCISCLGIAGCGMMTGEAMYWQLLTVFGSLEL